MRGPSLKIIKKQAKRLGLNPFQDPVPCAVKFCEKLNRAKLQQGYTKLSGPYFWVHRKDWEFRGRCAAPVLDVVWAVKKKPGKKEIGERKRRKLRHRLAHSRAKRWREKQERRAETDRRNIVQTLSEEIARLRGILAHE